MSFLVLNIPIPTSVCPRVSVRTKTGSKFQFIAGGTQYDEYNIILLTANGPVQCYLDHYGYGAVLVDEFFMFRRIGITEV
ncbi:hypothetical protein [Pedobacter agri]|uniref:hypothetical protein n=1 Tax=Pedobacter agri TaxID=454586 RepID=UPI00292F0A27|nr:hypothetical protein [Pedobacter agri]